MGRKIEVEVNGKTLLIEEHMMEDYARFGATRTKRTIKAPPKELVPNKVITPEALIVKDVPKELIPKEVIAPKEIITDVEPEVKTRKTRRKSVSK